MLPVIKRCEKKKDVKKKKVTYWEKGFATHDPKRALELRLGKQYLFNTKPTRKMDRRLE